MMRPLVVLFTLTFAVPAQAFIAQNGMTVRPETDGFTIPWSGRGGAADFWCAAGDFAVRALRLGPATVVYRASEPPRRSGEGMIFTLDPARAATKTGLVLLGADDGGLTAGHAQSLCDTREFRR